MSTLIKLTQVLKERAKICFIHAINFSGGEDLRGEMSLILYMLTFIIYRIFKLVVLN